MAISVSRNLSMLDGILVHEPAEVYHAQAKHFLSSHQLADFRKCPQLFYKQRLGLVVDEVERPAYLVGRAAHCLILEGSAAFDAEFMVGGPINPKTGKPFGADTKAFNEWAELHGKTVLTENQFALVANLAAGVAGHAGARELLASGVAEGVVRTPYCGVPCQIRIDWFDLDAGIVDLKTCDDLTWFEADAKRFGYLHQLAFYQAVLKQVVGMSVPVHLIGVEKKVPYRCGVWRVSPDALAIARSNNEAAIERFKECVATDQWPTGYEEVRYFDCAA